MRAKILLVHSLFNALGGAEFLALNATRVLKESGYDVTIYSCTPLDRERVKKIFNIDVSGFKIVVRNVRIADLLKRISHGRFVRLRKLMIFKRLFKKYLREMRENYDLIMETKSNLPTPADISYIHFPLLADKREEGGLYRIYNKIIDYYGRWFTKHVPGKVLTNSSWTSGVIYRIHHIIADIVHPPVDVEYFMRVADNDKREKMVVTISRFTPEKKLDKIVDVADRLRDYLFILIGTTDEYSGRIIEAIKRRAREKMVDNIHILTNAPRHEVLRYMRDSMFYLHPEFLEHFGISVVEAIASGLIPIVYRDGGAWYDIVSRVDDILGYISIYEAPKIIRRIESDRELYGKLRARSIEVSKMFSYENFKRNLLEKIEYVLRVKRIASAHNRA